MTNPIDRITAPALRPFYERDDVRDTRDAGAGTDEMSPAELAAMNADVRRIMATFDQLRSPAEALASYLGIKSPAGTIDGAGIASRTAASLAAAATSKRPSTSAPSAPPPTQSWAMRRFS